MTKITFRDAQEPFTPHRDRSPGFYCTSELDPHGEPVPVDIPMFLHEPALEPETHDARDAEIAALKAQLAAKDTQSQDTFDAAELADLIREDEPHASAQRRWLTDYTQLTNRMVDIRLPALSDAERAYQRRLQAALYSGRRGAVETI